MTFLAPYWLFAASAILIPIAIHLWNKKQGKTVKVGSLRWLEASASRRWNSIKLNNFWLLVLRCLILIVLVIALAQPVVQQSPQKQLGKKAIYIGQELLYSSALAQIKPTINSLLQRGYTLHTYTPDFEQIEQEKWQEISSRTQDSTILQDLNYWSLLPALSELYNNPQDSVLLFTSDQLRFFAGARPEQIPENITWVPIATNAKFTWLQTVVQTSPDSLLLILGHSSGDGIAYIRHHIKASTQSINLPNQHPLQLQRQNDTLLATLGNISNKVKVQQEPLQIAILADEAQQLEVQYLKAAITAISSYTNMPISIEQDTLKADWLFWLNSSEISASVKQHVKDGAKLWVQIASRPSKVSTSFTSTTGNTVKVHQTSEPKLSNKAASSLWITTDSQPLLTEQPFGLGKIYTFRSGFSPAWSELGTSAQLPELLLPFLFPATENEAYDLRAIDEQQLLPSQKTTLDISSKPQAQQKPLLTWLVLAAIVLFLIERLIANRHSKV